MSDLHPIHWSLQGKRRLPNHMGRVKLPHKDMKSDLTNVAISIFTDCVNVAVPFQDALLAVYLSGLQHGHAIRNEEDEQTPPSHTP